MDFSFTEEQDALRELAEKILTDVATDDALKALDESGDHFLAGAWKALGEAGLLGVALPEDVGGMGMGLIELLLLCREVGRSVAPVPVLPSLVQAALPIDRFGSDEQRRRLLPGVATGETILTAALAEVDSFDLGVPSTVARPDGDAWLLDGVKMAVPFADRAERVLVVARTGDGMGRGPVGVFLIDPEADGVTLEKQRVITERNRFQMTLAGVKVEAADVLGDPRDGGPIVAWLEERALVALCAEVLGVCEKALAMTATYTAERQQFGRPIATFQAVGQRAADAFIDVESIKLSTWHAAWRLSEGLGASEEVSIAKYWASEGGHRVVYACTHLHGGMGVDKDYRLYRYYHAAKMAETTLGGAQAHLARLGELIAEGPGAREDEAGGAAAA